MPSFDIVRKVCPEKTFRVSAVMGTYDMSSENVEEHFTGNIDLPEKWSIGLIVGNSGTGKTTIAKELFPDAYVTNFSYTHETILDDMPEGRSITDISKTLCSVGFSSPPSWLKPYAVLSNGEKMRCDLARAILSKEELFVFDEFTSVVDRNIAKIGSFAMQKAIRKTDKRFIAVTCHFDVEDWLMPDWVFDTNSMTFRLCSGEQKKNRPFIRVDIYDTKEKEYYWKLVKKYHYLTHSFNKAAKVYIATINGDFAGFSSIIKFPHPKKKNAWRGHRTVVLPDFQGIGLSMILTKFICEELAKSGQIFITTTSNVARVKGLMKDKDFVCTRKSRTDRGKGDFQNMKSKGNTSSSRVTYAFEYRKKGEKK